MADRTAFVTGAGRNIGRAIAGLLAAEGAAVAVVDVDAAQAHRTAQDILDRGGRAMAVVGDVSDARVVDDLFDVVEDRFGLVDAVVNNAYARVGATSFNPFLTVDVRDWELFMAANTSMFFATSQRAARSLAAAGRPGSIVNVSSHGADRVHRRHIAYDSMKGALESFTRAIAVDLAPWRIRANCVRPGSIVVDSERMAWGEDDTRSAQIPLGRPGSVDDVAEAVLYLASERSAYVTGQTFNVDGGLQTQGRAPQVEPSPLAHPGSLPDVPTRLLARVGLPDGAGAA